MCTSEGTPVPTRVGRAVCVRVCVFVGGVFESDSLCSQLIYFHVNLVLVLNQLNPDCL